MSYDLMFQKAIDLQNSGAFNEAEAIYLQLLQVMPANSDIWNLLGLISQSRGDLGRAVDCFLSAIKYAPRPFFAHFFNLGLAYKSLNKPKEAMEMLKRAAELSPDIVEIWNALGVLQAETGTVDEAIKSFCKALDVEAAHVESLVNLCYYTNDFTRLLEVAEENENSFYANFKAADCVEDAALKEHYLKRAVMAAPERTDGLLALAEFYRQRDDFNISLTYYHKVLNLDDNDVSALLGVADIYLAQKEFDKAEKYYLKSFEQSREIAGVYLNYGILLYQTGRTAEALEVYRKAAALSPETPEISYNLALILKETGDLEEALGLMFNAHLKAPENQVFIINIAETLALLFKQNAEMALKIAENWQKLEPENVFSKRLFAGMSGLNAEEENVPYAEKLFDAFAENYEETLARLEPKIISKFKEIHGDIQGRVLDLGCGTGLVGAALKNDNNSFDGVDVSAKMLDVAQEKGVYHQLYQKDITAFLRGNPPASSYDIVLAFDVFCYLGDLREIFSLLKGSDLWFTVESAEEDRPTPYYLTPSGRYKHKESYVRNLLNACGFEAVTPYLLVLRMENGEEVNGVLFHAR